MMSRPIALVVGAVWSFVLGVSAVTAQQENAAEQEKLLKLPEADQAEYQRVEGAWKGTFQLQGVTYSGSKTHKGGKSKVSFFDGNGKLLSTHTSEYKLKNLGDLGVFVYFNRKVIEGPNKGKEQPGVLKYIYKVVDDQFFEIQRAFTSQSGDPNILIWKRVKPEANADTAKAPDIAGSYRLVTINGRTLPFTVTHEGPGIKVTSGTFTIRPDGACTSVMAFVTPSGQAGRREVSATYTRDGSKLTMQWQGAGMTSGTVEGDTFTMENEGQLLLYRKTR